MHIQIYRKLSDDLSHGEIPNLSIYKPNDVEVAFARLFNNNGYLSADWLSKLKEKVDLDSFGEYQIENVYCDEWTGEPILEPVKYLKLVSCAGGNPIIFAIVKSRDPIRLCDVKQNKQARTVLV